MARRGREIMAGGLQLVGAPTPAGTTLQSAPAGSGLTLLSGRQIPPAAPAVTPQPGAVGGGQTLAAVDSRPSTGSQAAVQTGPTQAQQRGQIESAFNTVTGALRGQESTLRGQQEQLAGLVGGQFATGRQALQTGLEQGQANIQRAREKVRVQGAETLRDLAGNIRSAFEAGNIRLGAGGASDSSAAQQYALALTRLQNQNRADVLRQGQEQLSDLDFEEQALQSDFQTQLDDLEQQKNSRLTEISLDFQNKINAINAELVNANLERRNALAELRVDVANDALGQISQLDTDVNTFISQMTDVANRRIGEIDAARLSQTGAGFTPTTQLGPVDTQLVQGPTAAALGDVAFFRPASDEE